MKLVKLTKITLGCLLVWGTAAQAEVAGRILVAVGDTIAVRAGKDIKLAAGSPVENGDTLRVGEASNLQVEFTDDAIMALRPNTTMRIDDYAFTKKVETDKSIFSILKGGLRTITGAIGRNSRDNYAVKSDTATIGIRGTHFNIVHCANDCRNNDGTTAPNGTFGGVTDGRIVVINNAGQREFGKSEFFHVASRDALPASLIAPPSFLRDRLDGQAKSRSKDKAPTAAGTVAASTSTNTTTSTQPAVTLQPSVVVVNNLNSFVPAEQPAVSGAPAGSPAGKSGLAMASALSISNNYEITIRLPEYFTKLTWSGTGLARLDCPTTYGPCFMDRNKATTKELGTDAGVIEWGRWVGGPTTAGGWGNNLTFSDTQGFHYVVGVMTPLTSMPSSGSYTYSLLGATSPTFTDGIGGGLGAGKVTAATASVDFAARSMSGSMNLAFNGGSNTYSISFPTVSMTNNNYSASGTMTKSGGSIDVCGVHCSVQARGFFAGDNATHLGYTYQATTTTSGVYMDGAAVLKR